MIKDRHISEPASTDNGMRAYNETYLPYVMRNIAAMMDRGINRYGIEPEKFYGMFISSGIAELIGKGNPRYSVGCSGIEIADEVMEHAGMDIPSDNDFTPSLGPEYWAGWALAYYQWKSAKSFAYFSRNGLDINRVISMYHPLHEADLEKFCDYADEIIANFRASQPSPVKTARERLGITQQELSELSGISLRMIRAYEQKSQDITKASYGTVKRLVSILGLIEDDIEYY